MIELIDGWMRLLGEEPSSSAAVEPQGWRRLRDRLHDRHIDRAYFELETPWSLVTVTMGVELRAGHCVRNRRGARYSSEATM